MPGFQKKMQRTSRLLFLSSLLTLLTAAAGRTGGVADSQNKAAKQIWAIPGEDIELPCDLTPSKRNDTVNMVLWFKDDGGIPLYNLDARNVGGDLYKAVHWTMSGSLGNRTYFQVDEGNLASARLKVKAVAYEDQGVFRCRVDFDKSPTHNFLVNLTLIEQPTKPVIYDAQGREVTGVGGPFLEGYDLLLTCQVSGGKPRPRVSWWQGDVLLDDVMETPLVSGSASKFTENRLFIGRVTRSLWGAKLECRAESSAQEKSKMVVRKVPLDIYLKPAVVNIVLAEDEIYAGRAVSARCETWGSSPAARIVWRLAGLVIRESSLTTEQRSNFTASKLALVLDKDDDGKELTCRAENPRFPGGVLERTKVLRVLYGPSASVELAIGFNMETLREGDDVKFVCNYRSNPEPSSIEWFHNNKRLEHDVEAGVLLASSTLTLRVLTLAHSGAYSCLVRNSMGEIRSEALAIHMKYAPRCRPGHERQDVVAARDELLRLRCEVEADPRDSMRYSWTRNSSLGDVFAVSHPRPLSSQLEYRPSADEDFGTLACWASNSVGRQKSPCIFNVLPAKPPQKPVDCSLRNESSAMEVNCIPGANGGLPQHFVIEVHSSSESSGLMQQIPQSDQGAAGQASAAMATSTSPAVYQDRNEEPSFQLYGLMPGYDYTIAVFAENSQGRSLPVLIENIRVAEFSQIRRPTDSHFLGDLASVLPQPANVETAFIVIGLIIAVALILVGIGVAIGLVICRRRGASQPAQESLDDFTTPTYISAQRIEPRIRYGSERRRSQRTSLYMEESRNEPDLLQQVDLDIQH
ncbi:muscle M-line assembly protein unc-89 [Nasonia vitripennis]|uniref:Ig-like domain-containing protein n=1 Tax=Nasonia vitripennis TaxID=7425 RepID=A0A7M7QD90_NASVI|nr:muscle M-line assembly protein unc-89 [Nasonia vitripennis]XP_031784750.1 muscle M-line assembly protein unc-89 [Nasonia vitripennis]XP_031784751.1 muscle M-line assembly protein unc-89 [Nasonia vitripennis]